MNAFRSCLVAATLASLLAGCGGSPDTDRAGAPDPSVSPSPTDSPAASSAAPSSASPSSAGDSASPSPSSTSSSTPPCATSGLRVSRSSGEGAAGSTYYSLRLTNVSGRACTTGGFGGVSFVHGATAAPIGAPADRVHKDQAGTLTLRPGAHTEAVLQVSNAQNYPASKCSPTGAAGLRVYPPNQTRSAFVALQATACRSAAVHLLSLSPYRRGGMTGSPMR